MLYTGVKGGGEYRTENASNVRPVPIKKRNITLWSDVSFSVDGPHDLLFKGILLCGPSLRLIHRRNLFKETTTMTPVVPQPQFSYNDSKKQFLCGCG